MHVLFVPLQGFMNAAIYGNLAARHALGALTVTRSEL